MKCDRCVHSLKNRTGVPSCWLPRCVEEWDNDSFYTTQRWKELREKVLRRDKYLCVECSRYGKKTPATVVHHIWERSRFPELEYDINNLECLCNSCHNKKHPEKGRKRKGRY